VRYTEPNMKKDKYGSIWVSHSSMGDFLRCPRSYYLKNVYKDPKTGNKLGIASPALSLGVAVHEVLEALGNYPAAGRMERDLYADFDVAWSKVSGKAGGFLDDAVEKDHFERGKEMIARVIESPGPLLSKRIKLPEDSMLPNFFLSEEDNLILCGRVDWIEYLEEDDSLRIIDFKTGKHDEKEGSLQLPIYLLLANELQKRKVSKATYWYLDRPEGIIDMPLPDLLESRASVLSVAKEVKSARESNIYVCPKGEKGCFSCTPFEAILRRDDSVEFVGKGEFKQDKYIYLG